MEVRLIVKGAITQDQFGAILKMLKSWNIDVEVEIVERPAASASNLSFSIGLWSNYDINDQSLQAKAWGTHKRIKEKVISSSFKTVEIILYVSNQEASCNFYKNLFRKEPDLNVDGMTEFVLSPACKLGLMPNAGIAKILGDNMPRPDEGNGIPRCELYLYVDDIQREFDNAIKCGAKLISPIEERNWGDRACYFSDPDGHIIAFAAPVMKS